MSQPTKAPAPDKLQMHKDLLMGMLKDPKYPLAEVMEALKSIDEQSVRSVENETSMTDGEKRDILYILIEKKDKKAKRKKSTTN